jgi:hypothetical protein
MEVILPSCEPKDSLEDKHYTFNLRDKYVKVKKNRGKIKKIKALVWFEGR